MTGSDANDARPATPRKRQNRESEMAAAALELFSRKGYASSSLQDVADAVGVLKGSLYHYIDSKEDLLFTIFHQAHIENERLMDEVRALDVDPVERLRTYIERSVSTTLKNLERTTLYFRDWRQLTGERLQTIKEQRTRDDRFLRQLIQDALDHVGATETVDVKYVSSFVIGGTNWVADWFKPNSRESTRAIVAGYTQLAMAAVMGSADNS